MQKYINFQIPINVVHLLKRFDQFSNFVLCVCGMKRSIDEHRAWAAQPRLTDWAEKRHVVRQRIIGLESALGRFGQIFKFLSLIKTKLRDLAAVGNVGHESFRAGGKLILLFFAWKIPTMHFSAKSIRFNDIQWSKFGQNSWDFKNRFRCPYILKNKLQ